MKAPICEMKAVLDHVGPIQGNEQLLWLPGSLPGLETVSPTQEPLTRPLLDVRLFSFQGFHTLQMNWPVFSDLQGLLL